MAKKDKNPHHEVYSNRRYYAIGLMSGAITLYSLIRSSKWYMSLSVDERIRLMASVEEAFEAINAAVDNVTNGFAELVSRETAHLQAVINAHPAVSVDATPILNRLNALSDKMRNENFETIAKNDPNLAQTVGITPNPTPTADTNTGNGNTGNASSNPAQGNSETTTPAIGVSDSENPTSRLTPNPLGTAPTIPVENLPPTDANLANLQASGQSPVPDVSGAPISGDKSDGSVASSERFQDDNNPAITGNTEANTETDTAESTTHEPPTSGDSSAVSGKQG